MDIFSLEMLYFLSLLFFFCKISITETKMSRSSLKISMRLYENC